MISSTAPRLSLAGQVFIAIYKNFIAKNRFIAALALLLINVAAAVITGIPVYLTGITLVSVILFLVLAFIHKRVSSSIQSPKLSHLHCKLYDLDTITQVPSSVAKFMNAYNRMGIGLLHLVSLTQQHLHTTAGNNKQHRLIVAIVYENSNQGNEPSEEQVAAVAVIWLAPRLKYFSVAHFLTLPFLGGLAWTTRASLQKQDEAHAQSISHLVESQYTQAIAHELQQAMTRNNDDRHLVLAMPVSAQTSALVHSPLVTTLPQVSLFHVLDIAQYSNFDSYKKQLSQGMKRSINNNINKMKKSGYSIQCYSSVASISSPQQPVNATRDLNTLNFTRLLELHQKVRSKNGSGLFHITEQMFKSWILIDQQASNVQVHVLTCEKAAAVTNGEEPHIAGFVVLFMEPVAQTCYTTLLGLDYEASHGSSAYFNFIYALIEKCITQHGDQVKAINFGFTKDELKQKFGCRHEPFLTHIQACTPMTQTIQWLANTVMF